MREPLESVGAGITPGALGCRSGFPPIPAGTPEFILSRSPLTVFLWPQVEIIRATVKQGPLSISSLRGREAVKSSVSKRSIVIAGHKTSVSLEDEFWKSLKEIARERGMTLAELVAAIDGNRQHANLSSAIRLFVLGFYRDQASLKRVDAPIDGVRPL